MSPSLLSNIIMFTYNQNNLITAVVTKKQQYDKNSKIWKHLTEGVVEHLVQDMVASYSIEKKGFVNMLNRFDARYVINKKHLYLIYVSGLVSKIL